MTTPFSLPRCVAAALLGAVTLGRAQTPAVVQAEPFVLAETPLTADASGTTQIRMPDSAAVTVQSLSGMSDTIANLHVNTSGAGSFGGLVSLRGLSNTPYFSDSSVAVYFDDLPLGSAFTFPVDLFGFSTTTVSRGPQPAAAGRSVEGGLIQFSSAAPGPIAIGSLRAGVGNHGARQGALQYQTARGHAADATVSASYNERDGYITNTQLGTRVDDQQATSAAARVRVRPSAISEVSLQVLVNRHRDGAQPLVPIGGPLFTVARGREGKTDSDFAGVALKAGVDTPLGRLSSTTSRTRWTLAPYANRLVLPPTLDSQLTQMQSAWNEELRLASETHASIPWHVGAWFSGGRTTGDVNRAIPGLFPIEDSSYVINGRTTALFGEVTVPTGSAWRITAAVRAEELKKDFDRTERVPAPGHFVDSVSSGALQPKATAAYAVNADTHVSFSIGLGRKAGGWSAYTDKLSLARFQPERTVAYEAGIDSWLAGHTVKVTARVFDYEIRDYQIERSFNQTDYLVVNAPRARSSGAEVEASWHPASEWTFTASIGATDTTLREFTDPFTAKRYAGNRAPYTPDYDAHLGVTYRAGSGWFAAADVILVGRTFYDESQSALLASPAHATGNAQVGFALRRWRIALHAENVTDQRYTTLVIPGINHVVPGAPRTYGVDVALTW